MPDGIGQRESRGEGRRRESLRTTACLHRPGARRQDSRTLVFRLSELYREGDHPYEV